MQCTLNHAGYILVIRGGSRKSELGGHTETELLSDTETPEEPVTLEKSRTDFDRNPEISYTILTRYEPLGDTHFN